MPDEPEIAIASIDISKFNTRKNLDAGTDDTSIDDLANSIGEVGLLQPVLVRQTSPGRYELVSGQRRLLACKKLGLEKTRTTVRELTDEEAVAVSLIENVQRADMDPMDKARAYRDLLDHLGSVELVARKTGVSVSTIRRYADLLRLSPQLQQRVQTGAGPSGVSVMSLLAKTFADPAEQLDVYEQVKSFSAQQAEQVIRRSKGNVEMVGGLVTMAAVGEFNLKMCGSSLETCPYVPDRVRPLIRSMVDAVGN